MNRIYKVIWNEALGCFTAVGEYAKGHGKSSKSSVGSNTTACTISNLSSINTLRLSAIGLGLLAAGFTISPQVFSQVNVGGGTGDGTAISSCKTDSTEANAEGSYSVAIGCDADAGKNFNLVDRGNPSFAWTGGSQNDSGSTAIGTGTQAGDVATALGTQAKALGQSSVAIGAAAFSNGNTSLALGRQSAATANFAQAIGNVSSATGEGALAVGHSALASGRRGIAIGSTDFENAATVADQPNVGYRADGQTQAIGSDTIAFGSNAKATADNSLAFGAGSKSQVKSGVALGSTSIANRAGGFTGFVPVGTLSIDENAIIKTKSVALGAVSIGTGEAGGNRQIVNLAAGTSDSDAVNVAQLKGLQNGVNYTLNQGIDFGGDSGTNINRKLGEKLLVKGGETDATELTSDNNIGVVADGTDTLTIKLAKNLTGLDSVTTGNSLLNTNGLSITGGPTFTATGINANNQQIQGVASGGTIASNAANIGDLNTAITGVSTLGFALKAADGNTVQKPLGQAVEVVGSNNNIDTQVNNGKIEVELNNNLDLGSTGSVKIGSSNPIGFGPVTTINRLGLTTGNILGSTAVNGLGVFVNGPLNIPSTGLTADGLTILNGPSVTKSGGINAGNKKITNVKAGVAVDDAVNVSQLNSASAAARTEVGAGTNITDVVKTTGSNGQDIYTVNADGVTASAGSAAVTVTAAAKDTATNMTDYAVDLSDASKASLVKADSAMQSVVTQIDGNVVKTLDKDNNTANFLTGDNIVLTAESGGIKVATAPDVSFTTVTTGNTLLNTNGLSIIGGPKFTATGIDANNQQIKGVASGGTTVSNAANIGDLNTAITGVSTLGFGLKAADGNTVQKPLGQAVELIGANNNIDTRVNNGKIEVELNDNLDLGSTGSVKMGSSNPIGFGPVTTINRLGLTTGNGLGSTAVNGLGVFVNGPLGIPSTGLTTDGLTILHGPSMTRSGGIDAGNKKITNVKAGVAVDDAVNVSQLTSASAAARTKVLKGSNVASVDFSTNSVTDQDVYTVNADGVTASAGSDAVIVTKGDKDATNMTDYAVDLSDASKASLVKADSAIQSVVTQIDGNVVKTLNKTDSTANFLMGDNIVLTAEEGGIKVATAADVVFTSVTTGNTLLNTGGVSFLGGSTVRLSSMGLNNGGNKITNVDDGDAPMDAVNVRQLGAVTDIASRGWDISAQGNSATASNVGPSGTVDFNSKNSNIIVSKDATSNDVSFKLNDNLDLSNTGSIKIGSSNPFGLGLVTTVDRLGLTTGNGLGSTAVNGAGVFVNGPLNIPSTGLTADGLTILNGPSMTRSGGIDAGNKKITNVKAGVAVDDAVNVSQLTSASVAARTEVGAGTNITDVVKTTGSNGQDIYTVNADGVTASAGSDAVIVTKGDKNAATNMTDYAVDLSEDSKASLVKADSAIQSVITQIDGDVVKILDKDNNTANFLTGDNIVLTAEEGGIKVATKDKVVFTEVTTGDALLNTEGVSFLGGSTVRLSSMGLNNGGNKITEVADGKDDTDAVNIRQLNATNSTLDLGLDFTGDDTTVVVNRKLGQTLTIQGGATSLTENNIGIIADEKGNLNVRLAEDVMLGKKGSVRMENTVLNNAGVTVTDGPNQTITLSNEGLDNGNNRIIKVAEGITPSDAVNFAQLTKTNNEIAKGIKIGDGNSDNDQQFALGDTINVTGDSNLTTVASATGVQVKLNSQLNLGDDGSLQIGNSIMNSSGFTFVDSGSGRTVMLGSLGLDNGGNTIRNVGKGTLDTDAVNVEQLKAVAIALDQGWGITAQGDIATMVKQGSTVDMNSRDGNIKVSRTSASNTATGLSAAAIPAGANDISFDLNPDVNLNSVTTGDTTINDNGLTIADGPSITKNGINAANNKITNVQNGEVTAESQEAINGSQLYAQGSGISSIIGGNTVYNAENGTFTNSNIGGTGQGNIDGAIASIREGTIEINENVQTNTTNIATNTTNIATNTTNIATNTTNIATNTTNIATNVTNIKANKDRLDAGLNFGADSGTNINKPVGDSSVLKFTGGNNITTTAQGSAIKFDLNGSINLDSVTTGNTTVNNNGVTIVNGPSMTANGIDAASNKITNVADGMAPRDAVNFGQLDAVSRRLGDSMNELGYKIGEVEDDANAGISAAMAMSSLPQAYIIGKSMIGGGIGTYNGESAVAIGFSKLSNDGRWVMKLNGTADTQGNAGASIGAGFHFD